MNIKWKIFMLITHLMLVMFMSLMLVRHITTGNVFGIVTAVIAIACWLILTISGVTDIKRYYKYKKSKEAIK